MKPDESPKVIANHPAAGIMVPLVVALCYAASLGLNFGISNQNSYLIRPLHEADPSLLSNDWATTEVTPHHGMFSRLAVFLFRIDAEGGLFIAANIVCAALLAWIVFQLIRTYSDDATTALVTFLLVISIMRFTGTASVSGSYLVRSYLQPSTLGVLGFLVGMVLMIRGRPQLSGFALALGGLFHCNYLVLGILVFPLAQCLMGREHLFLRCAKQLAFPLLALAWFAPTLLETAAEGAQFSQAREDFLLLRGPHHYAPATFKRQFILFFAWLLLGSGAFLGVIRNDSMTRSLRATAAFAGAGLCLIAFGTLLTTVVYLPQIAMIQPWRVAPFIELLCQTMFCMYVAREIESAPSERLLPRLTLALVGAGLLVFLIKTRTHWFGSRHWLNPLVVLAPFAMGVMRWNSVTPLFRKVTPRRFAVALACMVLFLATGGHFVALRNSAFFTGETHRPEEDDLFRWARINSEKDALFATPPELARFRLHARRAIVVDWKTPPFRASELQQWFSRLEAVSGVDPKRGIAAVNSGYDRMTTKRVATLNDEFRIDYVVLHKDVGDKGVGDRVIGGKVVGQASQPGGELVSNLTRVYENDAFVVLSTRSLLADRDAATLR